jgi:hypothetical protein
MLRPSFRAASASSIPNTKQKYGLWILNLARLTSFMVLDGVKVRNEMTTMLVRFVHLHGCAFVDNRLFFRS